VTEPLIQDADFTLYQGDAREVLAELPADSVDTVVTSPPYYRLRDYEVEGQIGLESSLRVYISVLTAVFLEVLRVLKPTGSLWLVIDDSYAGGGNYRGVKSEETLTAKQRSNGGARGVSQALGGIKDFPDKSLCLIPHRLAIALQESGWWVRQEAIWAKPNPMTESARDRCTRQHEYIFHLTKNPHYFWNWGAAQEPAAWERWGKQTNAKGYWPGETPARETRNMRSVWDFPSANYPEMHFAVFPHKLVARCLALSTPLKGTVLDPFMGSGTVAVVARQMGFETIGIELSEKYCEQIRRNTGQLSLTADGSRS
jgi:DNA modification methylase